MEERKKTMENKKLDLPDQVSLEHLKQIVNNIEKTNKNAMISFEFIIMSCFPNVYENILNHMTQSYIQGFEDGKKFKK